MGDVMRHCREQNLPSSVLGSRADGRFHLSGIGVAPNSHILMSLVVCVKAPLMGIYAEVVW